MTWLSLSWRRLAAAACWIGLAVPGSPAEPVTPLKVVHLETYESQVEEGGEQAARWLIRHSAGFRQIDIATGKSIDVNFKRIASNPGGRVLTNDGKFFGYFSDGGELTSDIEELTIGRTADGEVIVKLRADETLRADEMLKKTGLGGWPSCYLADDASHLWCLNREDEVFRIDLAPEPRVGAKVKLKGRIRDTFHIFATGSRPVVVAAACSNGGGLFQTFDGNLQPLASRRFSEPAIVVAGTSQPSCLLAISLPQSSRWQVIGLEGKEFKLVSSASLPSKWLLFAAALSPDAKYLVTSQASERRTIAVWKLATGALLREVELKGGVAELSGRNDRTILHLAFSKSGKYLTASDRLNAYLLKVPKLIQPSSPGESAQP